MITSQKVIIGVLVTIAGFMLFGSIEPTHYCEDREMKMYCSELTKYYGLENGKCINPDGNRVCRSGWEEIPILDTTTTSTTTTIQAIGNRFEVCDKITCKVTI